MNRGTGRFLWPTLFALLLAAGGLAPDLRAQAAAPAAGAPGCRRGCARSTSSATAPTTSTIRATRLSAEACCRSAWRRRGSPAIACAGCRSLWTRSSPVRSPGRGKPPKSSPPSSRSAMPGVPGVGLDPDLAECTPPTRRADIMAKEKPEEFAACSAQLERLAARLLRTGPPARRPPRARRRARQCHPLAGDPRPRRRFRGLARHVDRPRQHHRARRSTARALVRVLAVGDVGHLSPGLQTGAFGNRENWDLERARASRRTDRPDALVRWLSLGLSRAARRAGAARAGARRRAREVARALLSVEDLSQSLHPGHRSAPRASRHRRQHDVGSGVEGGFLARRPFRCRGRPLVGGRADLGDRRAPRAGDGVVVLARFGTAIGGVGIRIGGTGAVSGAPDVLGAL